MRSCGSRYCGYPSLCCVQTYSAEMSQFAFDCLTCGKPFDRNGLTQWCCECAAIRATDLARRRSRGATAVMRAIKAGRLKPAKECKCADCGKPAACYDHRDYDKPLDVDPVCKRCDCLRGPGKPYDGMMSAWNNRRGPLNKKT